MVKKLIILLSIVFLIIAIGSVIAVENTKIILKVDVPSRFEEIRPGDDIAVNTEVFLLKENEQQKIVDIILEYSVFNEKGELITKVIETKGILLRLDDVKEISLPKNVLPGVYTIDIRATYKGVSVANSDIFEVIKPVKPTKIEAEYLTILVILVLFVAAMIYEYKKFKYMERMIKKVSERDLISNGLILKRR
jgi:hypothetical protein